MNHNRWQTKVRDLPNEKGENIKVALKLWAQKEYIDSVERTYMSLWWLLIMQEIQKLTEEVSGIVDFRFAEFKKMFWDWELWDVVEKIIQMKGF